MNIDMAKPLTFALTEHSIIWRGFRIALHYFTIVLRTWKIAKKHLTAETEQS